MPVTIIETSFGVGVLAQACWFCLLDEGFMCFYVVWKCSEYGLSKCVEICQANAYPVCHSRGSKMSSLFQAEYAYDQGLAGVMTWSIDTDDFLGNLLPWVATLLNYIENVSHMTLYIPKKI